MSMSASELIASLRAVRDRAADAGDLARALEVDNELDDLGELGNAPRRTCRRCGSWADHVHDPRTGDRMRVHGGHPADDQHTATAVEVFALATTALPHHWRETGSAARVVVDLGPDRYAVTVHPGDSIRPGTAYISGCERRDSGQPLPFPAIHATATTTAAIVSAYHHARHSEAGRHRAASAEARADDPDDLLSRFRLRQNQIDAEIDAHTDSDTDERRDRLAALHREASELAAALDNHLSLGGPLPHAWAHSAPA
ncbi:hypothetical protein ACFYTQ_28105 [Nocardia sp. NPDC004068]|uniref:hypothetical protein n=1 Tax=Nocardia sp. NPDC004068 TaxID=3364303 RepID=UPI0036A3A92B